MSDQLEDLYVKGVLAYNEKDFKTAKSFWEQVLASDPNHAKARQGMDKLKALASGKGRKRSSKEVFQEIKKLYAAKKFSEALKLTDLLLKKHPENKDLQGLKQKLEARLGGGASPKASNDKRSTMFMANAAEQSVSSEGEADGDVSVQVEKYIQEGVSLYEIQDYEQAIVAWKKAVALDPNNRIASEYIQNVSALVESDSAASEEPEPAPAPEAAPEPVDDRPSKEKMLEIYNEGMELYKARKYHEALDKWHYILDYYPNHAETLQCVEKTKAILAKEEAFVAQLEEIRGKISAGNLTEAESALTRLSIEAPNLSGLDEVQAALDEAKANAAPATGSYDALGLDEEEDMLGGSVPPSSPASATPDSSAPSDDITSFFSENKDAGPRQVSSVAPARKKKKQPVNVFKVMGMIAAVAILGVGGWYGYDMWSKRLKNVQSNEVLPPIVREVNWDSPQKAAEDFYNYGSDFEQEAKWILAAYAYQRVEAIATPRLSQLQKSGDESVTGLEVQAEISRLNETVKKSLVRQKSVSDKIKGGDAGTRQMELARTEIRREEFTEASERLLGILQADASNETAREMMGHVEERLGFINMRENNLTAAKDHFKSAAVLLPGYETSRRHVEVIQRYFNGTITEEEKDQWFFFFQN